MIEISKIRMDGGTQSRALINEATVAEYAEAMANPETVFPPAVVYFDGRDYWLADGFHRVAAWQRIGRTEIPCDVRQGDRRRAILHSVAANSTHGLRRTNEDKRRAVLTLLEDEEWRQWSDREIARRCAVHHEMVGRLRSAHLAETPDSAVRTVERGGTVYEQNTANIGKREPQPEPADCQPDTQEAPAETSTCQPAAAPPQPVTDPYGYAKLTEAALLDLANGLRADLDDEKARRKKAEAEARDAKAKLADHTADDKDEVIRRQEAAIRHKRSEMQKLVEDLKAEKRKTYALTKRVEELERMEIPLN